VQILNEPWPWWGTLRGRPLTITDLLARGTLTSEAAATLSWVMQRGASVFVAAGPPGAGKSTLANALLEYLPEDAQVYVTSGGWDRMEIPPARGPVYLLINELSAHMPVYLFGRAAQQAFKLLRDGVRIIGTLHARSGAEALRVMCYEADLDADTLAAPFVFVVLTAHWQGQHIVREVTELGFLSPYCGLSPLARNAAGGLSLDTHGLHALADWSGVPVGDVRAEIAERAAQLPV
jgi:energy-coupling factor transporter ATP-binding protein EcfA2